MEQFDVSRLILTYNLIIGLLLITSSTKIGVLAGGLLRFQQEMIARVARIICITLGSCLVAIVSIVLLLHSILRW